MNIRKYVLVSGKVQGVFFRSSVKKKADELHLTGWVRNLNDGSVEAVFEGEQEKVEKMVRWCGKGPIHAVVNDIKVSSERYEGEFDNFSIRM
jgi:acylphosphatase